MLKCYVWVHSKLSGINAGIQALHAVAELSLLEHLDDEYGDWARHHKTVVLLNGGSCEDLVDIAHTLQGFGDEVGIFKEEDFNNQVTAIAMVPDHSTMNAMEYLESMEGLRCDDDYLMYNGQLDLAEYLRSFRTHRG